MDDCDDRVTDPSVADAASPNGTNVAAEDNAAAMSKMKKVVL